MQPWLDCSCAVVTSNQYYFSEVRRMTKKFKWRTVVLTMYEKLKIIKFINAGTSYTIPVMHKVTRLFAQARSLCIWTCSLRSLDAFDRCMKGVSTKSQTHSNEKSKHVRTKSQTGSNEKPETFQRDAKCVRMRRQTHLKDHVQMSNRLCSLGLTGPTRGGLGNTAIQLSRQLQKFCSPIRLQHSSGCLYKSS